MSSKVLIARHGNRFDFVYPQWFNTAVRRYDPPLSEDGIIHSSELAGRLKCENIDHIIASPFLRTIQTAHPVAQLLNLPIKLEAGLGEWHNPDWMTEKPQIHPRKELDYIYDCIDWSYTSQIIPIYPETEAMVLERMQKVTQLLIKQFSGNLLLIGHGISVLGITRSLLKNNIDIKASLCSLTILVNKGHYWQLELEADTSHLTNSQKKSFFIKE
ncbi:MAG: histidine phosphatase family protein [Cyanobacteria bacterium]|nr:histidine phosphatase family protein [Cyanobacteria bacterium CG_2015-16_32_12]NCO78804.1 histidine phosphatase family protein [Cyanobacteria bacterium CG_2015-22_32_23]NCS85907.1 histidine phosphatase family protein [Cyanobacteria bacterium CG_2015-02_32_10]